MPSGRLFKKKTFLCGHYEAQDILHEVDDVDLICLQAGPQVRIQREMAESTYSFMISLERSFTKTPA